jgi:regulatory protein
MALNKKQPFSKQEALSYITAFCSKEERCISDVEKKLFELLQSEAEIEEIIQFLISEKYIDETRYTNAFVNDKFRFNKWGKLKIAYALKNKKIPSKIIEQSLSAISEDQYSQQLEYELFKKLKSLPKSSTFELKGKLYRFAASRGFESELIQDLLCRLIDD